MRARRAGTKLPVWAMRVSKATWRMNVDLPERLGPVISHTRPPSGPSRASLGTTRSIPPPC
jgi:hypothetical protein